MATRLDRPVDHVVPYSRSVLSAANSGKPRFISLNRMGAWQRAINRVVKDAITATISPENKPAPTELQPDRSRIQAATTGGVEHGAQ